MKRLAILALVVSLQGCAAATLIDGTTLVQPGVVPGTDYRIAIINRSDVGFDGDKLADRQRVATALIVSDACKAPLMVGETSMRWGTWALGTPRTTYYSDWKCS